RPAAPVRAGFRVGGLLERRLDEVRLVTPLLSVGEHLPVLAGGHAGGAAPGWTIGRLATHDGRLQLAASETLPGVVGGFTFDLRELGTGTAGAGRPPPPRLPRGQGRPPPPPPGGGPREAPRRLPRRGLPQRRPPAPGRAGRR